MNVRSIAEYLGEKAGLDAETRDVVRFGIESLYLFVAGLLAVTLVAWLLGCIPEALAATGVVVVLRSFAGGAHLTGPGRCMAVTALLFPALGKAAQTIAAWDSVVPAFITVTPFVCLLAVLILAPVDNPAKPIRTAAHRRRLKILAAAAVSAAAAVQAALLAAGASGEVMAVAAGLGLLWQSFILTSAGHAVMHAADRILGGRRSEKGV
ncbi:MAG: accessory gene regulator B family protein [Bacillota bacterium]|nr:accessory gene regulator B family protein [Bacillota bacterium]